MILLVVNSDFALQLFLLIFSLDHPHSYLNMFSYLDATKPEYDDSQLFSQLDSQIDSQLTVARGFFRFASFSISIVLNLPADLAAIRQHAFALNAELT